MSGRPRPVPVAPLRRVPAAPLRRCCPAWPLWQVALLLGLALAGLPARADATFPGRNGGVLVGGITGVTAVDEPSGSLYWTSSTTSLSIHDPRTGRLRLLLRECTRSDVAPTPTGCEGPGSGRFSPDGRRVAFSYQTLVGGLPRTHLAVIGSDGRGFRELPRPARPLVPDAGNVENLEHKTPVWSPDGRSLLVFRVPPGPNPANAPDLYRVPLDGAGMRRVTRGGVLDADWSATGEIALTRPAHPGRLRGPLFRMRVGGRPRRVVARGAQAPSWSPDGSRIAFTGVVDERDQIFTVTRSGRGLRRFTRLSSHSPAWSPDGRRMLFFREPGDLFSAPLAGGRSRLVLRGNDNLEEGAGPDLTGPAAWQPLPRARTRRGT